MFEALQTIAKSPATGRSKSPSASGSGGSNSWSDVTVSKIWTACDSGDLKVMQTLWKPTHSSSIDMKDEKGRTLLQIAAYKGRLEIVQWLVGTHHANIGVELLFGCMLRGHNSVLLYLLEHANTIDVDTRDTTGRTLLLAAFDNKQLAVAKLLLARGASLTAVDNRGRGCISIAIKLQIKELLMLLLDNGIQVPSADLPALFEWAACQSGDWKFLNELIMERKIFSMPLPLVPVINRLALDPHDSLSL
jgi:serine/threonine-protein phosphatase 6 regulatory ankyrin repeat subunit B